MSEYVKITDHVIDLARVTGYHYDPAYSALKIHVEGYPHAIQITGPKAPPVHARLEAEFKPADWNGPAAS